MSKLTNVPKKGGRRSQLTRKQNGKFKIAICDNLDNGFDFKRLDQSSLKHFDNFIRETVGKQLSVTQVDQLFLRTKGKIFETQTIHGEKREIVHYGKNKKPFRIFGYYNEDGYFAITKIDPHHKTHME